VLQEHLACGIGQQRAEWVVAMLAGQAREAERPTNEHLD
jgi:hypothetical protein